MDLGLDGKVAIVAGASSGIGLAIAEELAREGARVAICGRDADRLASAEERVRAAGTGQVSSARVDLTDAAAVRRWVDGVADDHGALHVVVTNAGGPPAGPTGDYGLDAFRDGLELSLLGHIGMVQAALPHLRASGWGRILVVASETVRQPIPAYALSNVVRPGLVGYVKTLVQELGPGRITVNVVAPGYTATPPLLADLPGSDRESELRDVAVAAGIPLERVAEPEDVAAAAAFLASDRAGFITGTVQLVDGGRTLGM